MVTRFFSIQLRKDRTPPSPPPRKASATELTAGTLELDRLLTVHLQVCRALLQVLRAVGPGGRLAGKPGWGVGSSLQRTALDGVGSVMPGRETPRPESQGD